MDNKEIIKEKKRIEWIDSIKFICMICIIIGHFEFFPQKVETFFSAFSLTGFLLCTGYTFHLEKSIFYFIRKRFKQIIVPMIWMGMLIILSRMVLSFNEHTFIIDEIINFLIQIRGRGDELWFLALLFASSILFYIIVKLLKDPIKVFIVSSFLFIIDFIYYLKIGVPLPWHIQMYGASCLFLATGFLFKNYFEKIKNIFNKWNTLIAFIIYSIIWYVYIIYLNNPAFTFYSFGNNILFYLIFNFLGLFILIGTAMTIKFPSICNKIGQNTLIFYGLHGKLESLYETIFSSIIINNVVIQIFHGIIGTTIISVILIFISNLINKYFPFLVGRKR